MKKFFIKTSGCKTNAVESALISEILKNNAFEEVDNIKDADFYILNSCSVTHNADSKNLSYLRKAKNENPSIKTVLTGCMAQLEKEKIIQKNIADFVVGNFEKNDIAKILEEGIRYSVSDIFSHKEFRYEKLKDSKRTRASVKIQDGCNNRCSYCTIPYARGNNRSNSVQNIISQINLFVEESYYETVLTGIHIGQWGSDFKPRMSLKNLLEEIEKTNIKRYRLGSLDPTELTPDFIDFLSKSEKFCPHFHLSLQSVCDKMLKGMNRRYSADDIKFLVHEINSKFENVFIGSDLIVGFPGETDEDFEITLNNIKELSLSKIHVFPYSRRKGTLADTLPCQVSESVKRERVESVLKVSDEKLSIFLNKNLNTRNEVIIEKLRDKKTGMLKGVTKNYINVLIDADDSYKDKLVNVLLKEITRDNTKITAEIIG